MLTVKNIKTREFLEDKECYAFLSHVDATSVKKKCIRDDPIVRNFILQTSSLKICLEFLLLGKSNSVLNLFLVQCLLQMHLIVCTF